MIGGTTVSGGCACCVSGCCAFEAAGDGTAASSVEDGSRLATTCGVSASSLVLVGEGMANCLAGATGAEWLTLWPAAGAMGSRGASSDEGLWLGAVACAVVTGAGS